MNGGTVIRKSAVEKQGGSLGNNKYLKSKRLQAARQQRQGGALSSARSSSEANLILLEHEKRDKVEHIRENKEKQTEFSNNPIENETIAGYGENTRIIKIKIK